MSSTDLIRTYFAERYRAGFFLPLAVLLYVAGALALGTGMTIRSAGFGIVVAYVLVLSFRIQDDIADRPIDRMQHPDRVTVRATDLKPLRVVSAGAALCVIAVLAISPAAWMGLIGFGAIVALLTAWYGVRQSLRAGRRVNAAVVLLKYPAIAFVAAVAGAAAKPAAHALMSFVAMYAAACIYEFLHDRGVQT